LPQVMHIRRCNHELPIFKHSSHPSIDAGSAVTRIWVRWLQTGITLRDSYVDLADDRRFRTFLLDVHLRQRQSS
jgi:hypothetical protein